MSRRELDVPLYAGMRLLMLVALGKIPRIPAYQSRDTDVLLGCNKRNQKHRKRKGDSPFLFYPFPSYNKAGTNFPVCAGFVGVAGYIGNKKI